MKTTMKNLMIAMLAAAATSAALPLYAAPGDLLVHYTFDDAGNGGLNLLQAAVGADAIVRTNQTEVIAGLGDVAPVIDSTILVGLDAGDGAVAIPRRQHLAVPIPAALLDVPGHPYTLIMKIKIPAVHDWVALFNMPASNDTDEMVFLNNDKWRICIKQFTKESGSALLCDTTVVPDQWTTLTFAFGTNTTEVLFDGECVFSGVGALAGSYADCSAAGGYILVGADDNGEDALFYLADFQILDGTPPPPPYEPEVVLTPASKRIRLQDGQTLTGTGGASTHVVIAADATVTISNATVVAENEGDGPWAGITCEGDATIILKGANEVGGFNTDYPGIQAGPTGSTLVIAGDGSLSACGCDNAAGIGSGCEGVCGDIVINGGTITAIGGEWAAGIGSGYEGVCGNIVISGGTIIASSISDGCGIGCGLYGDCGDIAINGGTITAMGGEYAVGIGASDYASCGDITIAGGTVSATGGLFACGVGCGLGGECGDIAITDGVTLFTSVKNTADTNIGAYSDTDSVCGTVTVGGTVTGKITVSPYVYRPSSVPYTVSFNANGGSGSMAGQTFAPGIPQNLSSNTFTRAGLLFHQWNTAADGSGATYYDTQLATFADNVTLYAQWTGVEAVLSAQTGDLLVASGQTLTGTGGTNTHVVIAAGATVTLRDVSIVGEHDDDDPKQWAGVTCLGDAVIILEGTNVVRGFFERYPGLQAGPAGSTLVIRGTGSLTADNTGWASGIGAGELMSCGDIVIEGGVINAAGYGGAGIGGGGGSVCGDITIAGGAVTATGGDGGAGIGGGVEGRCGDITIAGGTVTTTGGDNAAGIGSGYGGVCGDITIASGVTRVVATHGENATVPIGAGNEGTCGAVTVAAGLTDVTEGDTRTISGTAYPAYLAEADASVKSNYVAWAAQYGPDTTGAHEAAFLLGIDPATPVPAGAALLRVAAFSTASGRIQFDIVSDVAPLAQKASQANTTALCNGYLVIYKASGLSQGGWTPLPASVTMNAQGHAIAELELDANAPGGLPPALFFRPVLMVTCPDNNGD